LRGRLEKHRLEPHFGIHGIYELARGLRSESKADAIDNFTILSDLDPIIGPTPEMLFAMGLDRLRTGAAVIPILDELNRASAKQQILRMASGNLEAAGREFLARRQEAIAGDYPSYRANQLRQLQSVLAAGTKRPATFEAALARFDPHVPGILRQILGRGLTNIESVILHERLDQFPALRSTVRANLYLWAVPLVSGGPGASIDKSDDYRHVIEASYCDVFITGDKQLARSVPRLHPELQVLTWQALEAAYSLR